LEGLFTYPSFVCIFLAILITIANVIIGVSILPQDKRKKGYRLHRYVYGSVLAMLVLFLLSNHFLSRNRLWDFAIFAYFLLVIPYSRKVNVTLHAIISSVGLILLMIEATFSLF